MAHTQYTLALTTDNWDLSVGADGSLKTLKKSAMSVDASPMTSILIVIEVFLGLMINSVKSLGRP